MYITNIDEAVPALRERLRDYLALKLEINPDAKRINCFAHNDSNPSMHFNSKTGDQTIKCFSCGWSGDIFAAAAQIEGLPMTGPEWVTETIPHLAQLLEVPIQTGEPTVADRERLKYFRLAQDISDLLSETDANNEYIEGRGWKTDDLVIGSISEEELISSLLEKGWTSTDIDTSLMIRTTNHHFFGEDKVTFVIKDFRGRPIAFQSRNLTGQGMKYINTPESVIYHKGRTLLGIDVALSKGNAKRYGLYVVEGPGDLAQLYRLGIYNAVAVCGTAFTKDHLSILKMLGIHAVYFSLDWDNPGIVATQRILKEELAGISGVSCWVVSQPTQQADDGTLYEDADSYLFGRSEATLYTDLTKVSAFEWLMRNISDNQTPPEICQELIPTIASETTAIQREFLSRTLSEYTGVSIQAIQADVDTLRSGRLAERRERLVGAAQVYVRNVERDPENVVAAITQHEENVREIEKEYERDIIGINYQLARYDALQSRRNRQLTGEDPMAFHMRKFTLFKQALAGGMDWTTGALIYLGGRANSGKTATAIALATDVALSDENAIVVTHFTDDSYEQVEPRFKTNIAEYLREHDAPKLTIGMANNPSYCRVAAETSCYYRADAKLRELISNERLIIIDMEDGSTLGTLEKNLRYIRARHPEKKLLVVCDNTHNYRDFPHLDATSRMTQISTQQKNLTAKYHCCMIATVEYRKNMPFDTSKIRLPVDDDIADARALMYRPNLIIHVYNDLHDRKDAAEIFWTDPNTPELKQPRLTLILSKNKLSSFKDKLVMDLDVHSVTLKQKPKDEAYAEFERYVQTGGGNETVYVQSDWNE